MAGRVELDQAVTDVVEAAVEWRGQYGKVDLTMLTARSRVLAEAVDRLVEMVGGTVQE